MINLNNISDIQENNLDGYSLLLEKIKNENFDLEEFTNLKIDNPKEKDQNKFYSFAYNSEKKRFLLIKITISEENVQEIFEYLIKLKRDSVHPNKINLLGIFNNLDDDYFYLVFKADFDYEWNEFVYHKMCYLPLPNKLQIFLTIFSIIKEFHFFGIYNPTVTLTNFYFISEDLNNKENKFKLEFLNMGSIFEFEKDKLKFLDLPDLKEIYRNNFKEHNLIFPNQNLPFYEQTNKLMLGKLYIHLFSKLVKSYLDGNGYRKKTITGNNHNSSHQNLNDNSDSLPFDLPYDLKTFILLYSNLGQQNVVMNLGFNEDTFKSAWDFYNSLLRKLISQSSSNNRKINYLSPNKINLIEEEQTKSLVHSSKIINQNKNFPAFSFLSANKKEINLNSYCVSQINDKFMNRKRKRADENSKPNYNINMNNSVIEVVDLTDDNYKNNEVFFRSVKKDTTINKKITLSISLIDDEEEEINITQEKEVSEFNSKIIQEDLSNTSHQKEKDKILNISRELTKINSEINSELNLRNSVDIESEKFKFMHLHFFSCAEQEYEENNHLINHIKSDALPKLTIKRNNKFNSSIHPTVQTLPNFNININLTNLIFNNINSNIFINKDLKINSNGRDLLPYEERKLVWVNNKLPEEEVKTWLSNVKRCWPFDSTYYYDDMALRFLAECDYEIYTSFNDISQRTSNFQQYCIRNNLVITDSNSNLMLDDDDNMAIVEKKPVKKRKNAPKKNTRKVLRK